MDSALHPLPASYPHHFTKRFCQVTTSSLLWSRFSPRLQQTRDNSDHSFLLKNFPFSWKQMSAALLWLLWLSTYSSFCKSSLSLSHSSGEQLSPKPLPFSLGSPQNKCASISITTFKAYRIDDSQIWMPGSNISEHQAQALASFQFQTLYHFRAFTLCLCGCAGSWLRHAEWDLYL